MHRNNKGLDVCFSSFPGSGGLAESWLLIEPADQYTCYNDTLERIYSIFNESKSGSGLDGSSLIFSRIFLSDIANQKDVLLDSPLYKELTKGTVSIIGQAPLSGAGISLLAYFVGDDKKPAVLESEEIPGDGWQNAKLYKGRNFSMLWTANYDSGGAEDPDGQTRRIFDEYLSHLKSAGMDLRENGIRTWVFVRDIDNHYAGMVKARREIFTRMGLTEKTRYLASTGIEGDSREPGRLVSMDALAMGGLKEGQVSAMEVPESMPPTIEYGVTFERGLRVRFSDRSHMHISGTASIDSKGEIIYREDVVRQAERTILNTENLLESYKASLGDLAYLILYVRDFSYSNIVMEKIRGLIPASVPLIAIHAPVCRPGWLVEVEGLAVIEEDNKFPDFF